MRITWFGHSCFRLDHGGMSVLFDPFLSHSPAFKGSIEAVAAGVTHVVLTHGHSDHTGDVLAIGKEVRPQLFANYELCEWVIEQGFAHPDGVQMMNTGGTVTSGGVSVTLVRADHSSAQAGRPLGSANGAIVRIGDGPAVWHLGDTDIFSDMALICEIHRPRIAIVPIGDRFTMGPRVAAMAVKRFMPGVELVLPSHYATFGLLVPNADEFVSALADAPVRVAVPRVGEAVDA